MGLRRLDDQVAMSEINVTPLVDVMLVLLVVFIVTAPLLMQAVKVNLPRTAAVPPAAETRSVQISIDAAGAIFVDQRPAPLLELEPMLRAMAAAGSVDLQIHADAGVPYGRVAQVMAAMQRAGVPRVSFVTAPGTADAMTTRVHGDAAARPRPE
jgi:biopolymer transport protein ExbD